MNSKLVRVAVFLMSIVAGSVMAGAIHTWASGDRLGSADLNANFQHIHNLMVGGHGARLVNADVSAAASIASSKLADYRNIPVAWVLVSGTCSSNPCTVAASSGVSSVTWTSTGRMVVTFTTPRTNATYAVLVTSNRDAVHCAANAFGTPTTSIFEVNCFDSAAAGAVANSGFSAMVLDND